MKKTIIALLALAGVAAADVITLTPGNAYTPVSGGQINANRPFTSANDYTSSDLKSIIDVIADPTLAGWYAGVGQGQANYPQSDVTLTDTGFDFLCRSGVSYEFVLAFVEAPEDTTALTMSFTSTYNVSASIWTFNKETESITLLLDRTASTANTPFTVTVDNLQLGSDDMIVFAWSGSAVGGTNGGTKISVTDVAMSATTAPIPEPTTATLSLLALAGLAARRRRK